MSKLKIQRNKEKILKLLNENIDLQYNLNLTTFRSFSEEVRNIGTKQAPKLVTITIGHWFEWFKDESRPDEKGVKIERSEIIEVDGERSDGWRKIKYYTIEFL